MGSGSSKPQDVCLALTLDQTRIQRFVEEMGVLVRLLQRARPGLHFSQLVFNPFDDDFNLDHAVGLCKHRLFLPDVRVWTRRCGWFYHPKLTILAVHPISFASYKLQATEMSLDLCRMCVECEGRFVVLILEHLTVSMEMCHKHLVQHGVPAGNIVMWSPTVFESILADTK